RTRDCGFARCQEAGTRNGRHHAHVRTDIRDPAHWHGIAHGCTHLRARACSRADRRAPDTLGWLNMVEMTTKHGAADAAAAAVTAATEARDAALREAGAQTPGASRQAGGSPQPGGPQPAGGSQRPQQPIPPMPRRKLSMFDRALLGPAL